MCRLLERARKATRGAVEKLARRVERGQLRAPEKIGEAAGRLLARHHGCRYYGWRLREGRFVWFEHPVHVEREKACEGHCLIQTEEREMSPVEPVRICRELPEVERGVRELKDVVAMRSVHHPTPSRVEAHMFAAAPAFPLSRALAKKLEAAQVALAASAALEALRTVISPWGERRKGGVTAGSSRARQILAAVGITDHEPPLHRKDPTSQPKDKYRYPPVCYELISRARVKHGLAVLRPLGPQT